MSEAQENTQTASMPRILVRGGKPLYGEIKVMGAKNAALKLICASILSSEPVHLTNCPNKIRDLQSLIVLLETFGVSCKLDEDKAWLHAKNITNTRADYDLVRKMRSSILVLGPLLARCHEAQVSLPGGCAIGTRPVDFHIEGLKALGADITLEEGYIIAKAKGGLKGGKYIFPKISHTGTENVMMAATLAKGTTVLANCAREPEVEDLANLLNAMGAKITGAGTPQITIEGVEKLGAATHRVLPDRIETGTYAVAVAMTGGELRLKNARLDLWAAAASKLEKAGATIVEDGHDLIISRDPKTPLNCVDIMTEPFPAFPTDLQAQFMAMLTTSNGAGMVTETIFENRFMHVPELSRMGADITVQGNSALVRGVKELHGAEVMATDLRASVALVLAGLVATGETTVNRIYHLERGYIDICGKLAACGADIERVS